MIERVGLGTVIDNKPTIAAFARTLSLRHRKF